MRDKIVLLCLMSLFCVVRCRNDRNLIDINDSEYSFTSDGLPGDDRYMSTIGNGHIATSLFSDTVYMNGLYNGAKGESHRARIPAWSNIHILNSIVDADIAKPNYTLDTKAGTFFVHLETSKWEVEHRIYAHRYYTRAIVNQFYIIPKDNAGDSDVQIDAFPGDKSADISFNNATEMTIHDRKVWKSCGETFVVEDARYQKEPSNVCIYWTDITKSLEVTPDKPSLYTFVMTVDTEDNVAKKEMSDVLQLQKDELFNIHKDEWGKLLSSGNITIEGNLPLSKVVNGAWYYLLSSLPSLNSSQPLRKFRGLSPGGLSRGGLSRDYQGHSFWDTETWMYPPVLLLQPQLAKQLLQYRVDNQEPAEDLAVLSGHKGIRFPWESAFTGAEVTPDCCPEVVKFEHHITGCIAFAIRQYISMTGDKEWLNSTGCSLVTKIAEFWASRAELNEDTKLYDIKEVMGPDEDHPNVTNSVFTNVVAGLALYLGDYAECLCGIQNSSRTSNWTEIASKLTLPFDAEFNYHPQYEGYNRSTIIKQADVVLLGFPLLYRMHPTTRTNDLLHYENVTRDNGPAMTWSMHTVGHLQLGNNDRAAELFNRSYQPYVREPFKIWTEAREPDIGAVNFITGMGGFLQSIVFGYGGINMYLDRLEFSNPQPIANTTGLKINGIKYYGNEMSINIQSNFTEFHVHKTNPKEPLILHTELFKLPLFDDMSVQLTAKESFKVKKEYEEKCPVPLDLIGQY